MKKTSIFIILYTLLIKSVLGQEISIKVTDKVNNNILSYTAVAFLKESDSTLVKGILTDSTGYINIKSLPYGNYRLKASHVGYKDTTFNVKFYENLTLNVYLNSDIFTLNEVVVSAKRPLIDHKIDRIVFNVDNSIFSKGFNTIDLLRIAPRIQVSDDDKISIVGKSVLQVMIDGKIFPLSDNSLRNKLKAMISDEIDKIEIITIPPAKYSANGNSGLINIVTKKSKLLGWSHSINGLFIQRTYSGFFPSLNSAYKSKKIDLSIGLSGFSEGKRYENIFNSNFVNSNNWFTTTERKGIADDITLNSTLNYSINSKWQAGFIGDVDLGKSSDNGNTKNLFYSGSKLIQNLDSTAVSKNNESVKYLGYSFTLFSDLNIDSLGKKMSINVNIYSKSMPSTRIIENTTNTNIFNSLNNKNDLSYSGSLFNIDFELPYKFVKIETGTSLAFSENQTNFKSYNTSDGNFILNNNVSNNFKYNERTAAIYISISKEFNSIWSSKFGLRYEKTDITGESLTLSQTTTNDYFNFFPSIFINCNCNPNNSFSVSYAKRIERPLFYLLNPFRTYQTLYSYSIGNSNLLPSLSQNIEISYTYKNNFSTFLYGSKIIDGIDQISRIINNGSIKEIFPENHIRKYNVGVSLSYTYYPTAWLNSYNSFDMFYTNAQSIKYPLENPELEGSGGYFSSKNTFTLNKKKSTFLEFRYNYSLPSKYDFYDGQSNMSFDIGCRFTMFHDKFLINTRVRDIFRQEISRNRRVYSKFNEYIENYNDLRNFSISFSYAFGNLSVSGANKYINNPNKNRAIK